MGTRRSFLKGILAGGVLGQGFSLTLTHDLLAKPAGEPIRIGHQCDLTGGISSWGYWHDKAAKAAINYLNQTTGIAGRPVEYIVEDTETNPPTGARKFRSLVQQPYRFPLGCRWRLMKSAAKPMRTSAAARR